MKDFFKFLLTSANVMIIFFTGIWGYQTHISETSFMWVVIGLTVFFFTIIRPCIYFWYEKIESLFNSED
jgi:quinol-cytochrome oxidoreductase complex cytochrome b subunit